MIRFDLLAALVFAGAACTPVGPQPLQSGDSPRSLPPSHLELTTAQGEVVGVDRRDASQQLSEGLSVRLRDAASDPVEVMLAPDWFLDENGISYGDRERLEVRGKREQRQGRSVLIATEIRRGESWVPLRDSEGRPLWKSERK